MATAVLLALSLCLAILHPTSAQDISDTSFVPSSPSPSPTKPTVKLRPPSPPRGTSYLPNNTTIPERLLTKDETVKRHRLSHSTTQSTSSHISAPSTSQRISAPVLTQQTAHSSRPDSLPLGGGLPKSNTPTKASTVSTSSSDDIVDSMSADTSDKTVTTISLQEKPVKGTENDGGTDDASPSLPLEDESVALLTTIRNEMAQFWPQTQTMTSQGPTSKKMSSTVKPHFSPQTTTADTTAMLPDRTRNTPSPNLTVFQVVTGELSTNTSPTIKMSPKQNVVTVTPTTTTDSHKKLPGLPFTADRQTTSPLNVTQHAISTSAAPSTTMTQTTSKTTNQSGKTAHAGRSAASTTVQTTQSGTSSPSQRSSVIPILPRFGPTLLDQRNHYIPVGNPHQVPHSPPSNPKPSSSSISPIPNATLLHWGDLSRTLSFAWELHVYGSASLFLLLFAGAALGLTLSPGMNCPHRGALVLANALLFLAGGVRAAFFLIDPYGARQLLPRPAVIALYNLPLHLLVWTQAALALLALRVAGITVLPATLERPPLVAVLAVLQCTLLLAADLLSSALSPAVPVTLQVLSLCWGLAICLGFLCYIFPRLRCPAIPNPRMPEDASRKTWTTSLRTEVVLGRVLAVCGLLGALCSGLHIHATLWLYGLLGNWRHFNWGWWLVHFWARLLELAWGFSLLLLGSWVFWKPQVCRVREEGGSSNSRALGGDISSPGQSQSSTQSHTCWSKIVQSLRGKPCRKSDSNGVGGAGTGEMPNNWAGQERPGADISKSLIRNQNHELVSAQPRCIKDSNRGRNQRGPSADRGASDESTGSLVRLQALGRPPQRSMSGSLDLDKDTSLSLCDFDLRPPSPIDLSRSIDAALHREHLLGVGSLFQPFSQTSPYPSPGSGVSQGPWLRRNSDPELLSDSSDAQTESSMPLGGSVLSSVPSRQVTEPPTPSHQCHRWTGRVPSSVSCPVSLHPSRTSTGHLEDDGVDDTRPFITPDSEKAHGRARRPVGSRSYLEVSRQDDLASVGSEIIDL